MNAERHIERHIRKLLAEINPALARGELQEAIKKMTVARTLIEALEKAKR